jgi:L-fucose mutarotase
MLKGISPLLSPELLKILMEMGHGDEIVLADANFPAASHAQRLVRSDGLGLPALLEGVLQLFPLDTFVTQPAAVMAVVPGDRYRPALWPVYRRILRKHDGREFEFELIERSAFYERTKLAYAVVATGETARYANIILKKGIL